MAFYNPSWRLRSKGAILTLFQDFVVMTTAFLTLQSLYQFYFRKNEPLLNKLWYAALVLLAALFAVTFLVAGWLSDECCGRFKMRRFGLWLIWAGVLWGTTSEFFFPYVYMYLSLEDNTKYMLFNIIMSTFGFSLASIGCAAYLVNAVPFGIDQMPDASSEELSAYIHWVVCTTCTAGIPGVLIYLCPSYIKYSNWCIAKFMIPMTMLSLALCCDFLLRGWLIMEPRCPNSLRMIYRVLKFAATHKYPIRRRAITYTEDEKPSRIDFAKDKYGGPFTTEQVEDVKTFFRIVAVLLSTVTVLIPLCLLTVETGAFLQPYYICTSHVAKQLACSVPHLAVEILLLYSFVIHPLCKKQMLSMLQRILLAALFSVLLSAVSLVVEMLDNNVINAVMCGVQYNFASVSYTVITLYNFTIAIVVVLFFIATLEFTCAQSPYHLRGLLIGLMYCIVFFSLLIVSIIMTTWQNCGFYYCVFQLLCAVVGLIVLCIVARWYKRRQREEEDDQRRIVEEIYSRMLQHQNYAR